MLKSIAHFSAAAALQRWVFTSLFRVRMATGTLAGRLEIKLDTSTKARKVSPPRIVTVSIISLFPSIPFDSYSGSLQANNQLASSFCLDAANSSSVSIPWALSAPRRSSCVIISSSGAGTVFSLDILLRRRCRLRISSLLSLCVRLGVLVSLAAVYSIACGCGCADYDSSPGHSSHSYLAS